MNLHEEITLLGQQARQAAYELAQLTTKKKNNALEAMANELESRQEQLKDVNELDLQAGREAGLSTALLDRLTLTDERINSMIKGIRNVVALPDPVNEKITSWMRPNGLAISKVRVPIGVIGIIYESRPNVTADAAVLCLKTSNAVILRGGKEAVHSNRAIAEALQAGCTAKGLPQHAVQLIQTTDREAVRELVQMDRYLDVVIPRGGEGLIRAVTEMSRVPVIKHYKGVCHVYIDESADLEMGLAITENAKCQRPGVCNAIESLLVHEAVAEDFLPRLVKKMPDVELRGCPRTCAIVPTAKEATEEDWEEEYLDLILSVKIVDSLDEAVTHINRYGSHHSDAIVSASDSAHKAFLKKVDSATVYVNASTRFTDGGEFGMGAEIGISTDKLHARGPMGLEELTTYKYQISGTGQIRP